MKQTGSSFFEEREVIGAASSGSVWRSLFRWCRPDSLTCDGTVTSPQTMAGLKAALRWCRVWTTEGWSASISIYYEFYSSGRSSKWNYKQQKDSVHVIKWSTRNVCLHVLYWPAQRLAGWRVGFWHKLRLLSVKPLFLSQSGSLWLLAAVLLILSNCFGSSDAAKLGDFWKQDLKLLGVFNKKFKQLKRK